MNTRCRAVCLNRTSMTTMFKGTRFPIPLTGSLQNPAWSSTGRRLLVTQYTKGYSTGPSNVSKVVAASPDFVSQVVGHGYNVSPIGSAWSKRGEIVFSSDRDGVFWPWAVNPDGSNMHIACPHTPGLTACNPTWAPDGIQLAAEVRKQHKVDNGSIAITIADGALEFISKAGEDARRPNWSPDGKWIVWHQKTGRKVNLFLYSVLDRRLPTKQLTTMDRATDATFSPDSQSIIFSAEGGIWTVPVDRTRGPSILIPAPTGCYFGAPSWSPDGKWIAYEAYEGEPEGGPGTWIEIVRMV